MKNIFPQKIQSVLMVEPRYFDVEYSINPFMVDAEGNLKKVDRDRALQQWQDLKAQFQGLGLKTPVLAGAVGFPDMVFCANQSFPFLDPRDGKPSVLLSRMRAPQRAGEVDFFKAWFAQQDCAVYELHDQESSFEANGDVIPVPGTQEFWGGVGPRTDRKVYAELQQRFELKIHTVDLIHPSFYHLDTCFFAVRPDVCAYVKEALSAESILKIQKAFTHALEIPLEEALDAFAGNAFCPDGQNVVLHKGALRLGEKLKSLGLNILEVDTSEFMKSGGSVFCMKLALPFSLSAGA